MRNLGVMWDSYLNMNKHVIAVIKSCNFHLSRIAHIRSYLTIDACKTLIQALVIARLDYGNSTLCGLPVSLLTKLQKVQNRAARLVTGTSRTEHITPKLKQLHWLTVEYRIRFMILVMTYKALRRQAPRYLIEMFSPYYPKKTLRSAGKSLRSVPQTRTILYGKRHFRAVALAFWNDLPLSIHNAETLTCFKRSLTTHFFI